MSQPINNRSITETYENKDVVLDVKGLRVYYETPKGDVLAVDGIDFKLYEGETLGLVGESGCGKSTAAMGILQTQTWKDQTQGRPPQLRGPPSHPL